MNSNVLLLVIDSLRSDKFYGKTKTAFTPNIDLLIKKGVYFSQTISSSDVTGKCLGNIFTGMYSYKTGINLKKFNPSIETIFDVLKKHNYNIYAVVPKLAWYNHIIKKFDDVDVYDIINKDNNNSTEHCGNSIVKRLTAGEMKQPWFYYIHLEDLHHKQSMFHHDKIIVPSKFNKKEFGETEYERTLSYLDEWIGKIINCIDHNNTIIIITADHGDYIPIKDNLRSAAREESIVTRGKTIFPRLVPIGRKLLIMSRKTSRVFQQTKLKKQLSAEQLRTLNARGDKTLYDETLRIPLLIINKDTTPKIIDQLVSGIDIFPTIMDLLGLKASSETDGRSLKPLINGETIGEVPIFIESGDNLEHSEGFVIGVRTPKFKYFRDRDNPMKNVNLYDLDADPSERNNMANSMPEIVSRMEDIIDKFQIKSFNMDANVDEDDEKIKQELKKLGYI